MATHSNILAQEILGTEEPCGLYSMQSERVGHDSVTEHACISFSIYKLETRTANGIVQSESVWSEELVTREALGIGSSRSAEHHNLISVVGERRNKFPFFQLSSVQALRGLNEFHPHQKGKFTDPTNLNSNRIQKSSHRYTWK